MFSPKIHFYFVTFIYHCLIVVSVQKMLDFQSFFIRECDKRNQIMCCSATTKIFSLGKPSHFDYLHCARILNISGLPREKIITFVIKQ